MSWKTITVSLLSLALVIGILAYSATRGWQWLNSTFHVEEEEPYVVDSELNTPMHPDFDNAGQFLQSKPPSVIPHFLYSYSEETRTI
jgi:hypothetical protein